MKTEFISGECTYPAPFMIDEAHRLKYFDDKRNELRRMGYRILSERRVKNPAFDRGNKRTTLKVKIDKLEE